MSVTELSLSVTRKKRETRLRPTCAATAVARKSTRSCVANGRLRIVRIDFDHALLSALVDGDSDEDRALASDLVSGACNAALEKAQEMITSALSEAAADLGLPIPAGALEGLL